MDPRDLEYPRDETNRPPGAARSRANPSLTTAVVCFDVPAASLLVYSEVIYQRCRWLSFEETKRNPDCKTAIGVAGPAPVAPMVALGGMIIAESGVPLVILFGEFMLTETIHSLLFVVTAVQFRLMKKTRTAARAHAATVAKEESSNTTRSCVRAVGSTDRASKSQSQGLQCLVGHS